jgi:hypothetical protein
LIILGNMPKKNPAVKSENKFLFEFISDATKKISNQPIAYRGDNDGIRSDHPTELTTGYD